MNSLVQARQSLGDIIEGIHDVRGHILAVHEVAQDQDWGEEDAHQLDGEAQDLCNIKTSTRITLQLRNYALIFEH